MAHRVRPNFPDNDGQRDEHFPYAHDVVASVMELLTVDDLRSMCHTSRRIRAVALAVIRRRFNSLLGPYVASHLMEFIDMMRFSGAVITGSIARAMITGVHGMLPLNLNIVVPYESFRLFDKFIHLELGYSAVSRKAHPAVAPAICRFREYAYRGRVITISAARPTHSLLHIILNAPTTADMVVMSAGGVAWFYPVWLRRGFAIRTRSSEFVAIDHELGLSGEHARDIRLEHDLEFTKSPCGLSCPTLWHHMEDTSFRRFVDWDRDDSVTRLFSNIDLEWRLSPECTNSRCSYRVAVMERNLYLNGAHYNEDVKYMPPEIRRRLPV
ncbi:hypothetical protein EDD22DRAFT_988980 [Suillus occidentalis]|nr:hypothetical protein EDD22DRAFT_988980 [Suillus occidentalis]